MTDHQKPAGKSLQLAAALALLGASLGIAADNAAAATPDTTTSNQLKATAPTTSNQLKATAPTTSNQLKAPAPTTSNQLKATAPTTSNQIKLNAAPGAPAVQYDIPKNVPN